MARSSLRIKFYLVDSKIFVLLKDLPDGLWDLFQISHDVVDHASRLNIFEALNSMITMKQIWVMELKALNSVNIQTS